MEIKEIEITKVITIINKKIDDFLYKYHKYPKYLNLPLRRSRCMKANMGEVEHFNLDYNTELLLYKDLVVCETITIEKAEEIEVF